MDYSIEKIFKLFGQYDKIVTIEFFRNSPSYNEYKDSLTGSFYYSPKERKYLEENSESESSGFIKFKEVLNNVSKTQKEFLFKTGINSEDIMDIFYLRQYNRENKFQSREIRSLPKPHIIEVDIDDNFDYESMLINLNERKAASGHKLIPEETAEHFGTLLNFDSERFEKQKPKNDELNPAIRKHYLKSKLRHKQADENEIKELDEIKGKELTDKILTLREEIKNSGIGKKNYKKIEPQIEHLTKYIIEFHDKRLTHGKFPVWLDYNRFLHIFLRHVNETNPGGTFENKTRFQYLIDDILDLIPRVLDVVEEEIQRHFVETPEQNFKRHGEMSVYYNGDYYAIDINPSGLLMTFYKRE
jgi:hypothetical protein